MDLRLFLILLAGHYLADFPLQSEYMAQTKSKVFIEAIGFHVLTAHAFIHALVAGVITGNFTAGAIVGTTHWLIDFGKASQWLMYRLGRKSGLYGINIDQLLHVAVLVIVVLVVV